MFRYELVNSVSLLKKIYKRDAPFRAVFKVKTLAVLFSPYPCEVKHIPRNLNLPSIPTLTHSRPQSLRSFWPAAGIESSGSHTAVKRGARAQFPPKLSLNKVLNFPKFSLSSPKLRQSLKSQALNFAYDQDI